MVHAVEGLGGWARWLGPVAYGPSRALGWAGAHEWLPAAVAAFAAAGCAAFEAWRRRRAQEALEGRFTVELVPARSFDPAPAEVGWFTRQVASVRAAAGPVPQRAAGTRVRLVCVDGQMRYQLEGPARAASVLRMPGYQGVEVVTADARTHCPPRIRFKGAPPVAGGRRSGGGR
ncbi:hypothetical protein K7472_30920 [Streptomyces sp. PTM05]|uniref:Uncharacterized protein n=1 Tax=Streptantibioticus parmotrematis TaxID=2873249 RepID=A0ABS7R1B0_9ACTN|nr:hypothetical protein [Streptantibioticus parmotrematis]MBY8889226.1 hypothetical protein [Streptantibioticus parmotrematis]